MDIRFHSVALIATLTAASFATATGALAAHVGQPKEVARVTEMVPLIAVSRVTSPDREFIERATNSAIKTMNTSQTEINTSHLANIQGEAVRAFNTAASSYNSLADIASERHINVASPSSIFEQEQTPSPIDGAPIAPSDVRYLTMRQQSLGRTIAVYATEVKSGHDPIVVSFARQMKARLEHDLILATLEVKSLDTAEYGDRPAESDASTI